MIQKVVGISFNPTKDSTIKVGSLIRLMHDTSNKYSSRAIAVVYKKTLLGHIGEKDTVG